MVLVLTREDVLRLVTMSNVIRVVEQAHIAFARERVIMPMRLTMTFDAQPSVLSAMPACIQSESALGVKLITGVPGNAARGLPTIHAIITLFDPKSGMPQAIMDGSHITAMRTAAASGLATRLLARSDAHTLAIVGAGVQGHSHLHAMLAVRAIDEIRIAGRDPAKVERLANEARRLAPHAQVAASRSVQEAVEGADIIVTVTTATEPIVKWAWIRPGAHINGVGSHSRHARELPTEVIARSRIVVDSIDANLSECADIMIPIEEGVLPSSAIDTEIGMVAAGMKPGRRLDDEVTLYKSVGIALQDIAAARLVYQLAVRQGAGIEVEL